MHSPVSPKPVAAMLATLRESVPLAWLRSFTKPVYGLASSQKNWKHARSICSRKRSSSSVKRYLVGSLLNSEEIPLKGGGVFCGGKAGEGSGQAFPANASEAERTPSGIPSARREVCRSQ